MPVKTLHQHLEGVRRRPAHAAAAAAERAGGRAHPISDGAGARGPAAHARSRAEEGQ